MSSRISIIVSLALILALPRSGISQSDSILQPYVMGSSVPVDLFADGEPEYLKIYKDSHHHLFLEIREQGADGTPLLIFPDFNYPNSDYFYPDVDAIAVTDLTLDSKPDLTIRFREEGLDVYHPLVVYGVSQSRADTLELTVLLSTRHDGDVLDIDHDGEPEITVSTWIRGLGAESQSPELIYVIEPIVSEAGYEFLIADDQYLGLFTELHQQASTAFHYAWRTWEASPDREHAQAATLAAQNLLAKTVGFLDLVALQNWFDYLLPKLESLATVSPLFEHAPGIHPVETMRVLLSEYLEVIKAAKERKYVHIKLPDYTPWNESVLTRR